MRGLTVNSTVNSTLRAIALPLCALSLAGLAGCNTAPDIAEEPTPTPTETVATPTPTPTGDAVNMDDVDVESDLISANGIGVARLGMTLGDLKDILGEGTEFEEQSPFIVDFDAIAVRQNGEALFYILYLAGEAPEDSEPIQGLWTDNPRYQTAEGIGAGTSLQDAVSAYGQATLAFNYDNEGREYVRFANHPAPNLSFRTGTANEQLAGLYADTSSSYNETQDYQPEATIQSVLLICLAEGC
jgi:hypothetical protein